MPVRLSKLVFNPFSVNTYIIWDESKEAVIVDPGCYNSHEESLLIQFCNKNELNPKYLINTHCHIDHILGNAFVKEHYHTIYAAPEKDKFLLDKMLEQAAMFGLEAVKSPAADILLSEELELDLPFYMQFLFTPGHTPGEFCIYLPEGKFCITGDVLFREGIGRVDLWGGDFDTLRNSIVQKLLTLPDETVIYPGHGEESTIGYEKNNNPYF